MKDPYVPRHTHNSEILSESYVILNKLRSILGISDNAYIFQIYSDILPGFQIIHQQFRNTLIYFCDNQSIQQQFENNSALSEIHYKFTNSLGSSTFPNCPKFHSEFLRN